jgi:hypothetical protein
VYALAAIELGNPHYGKVRASLERPPVNDWRKGTTAEPEAGGARAHAKEREALKRDIEAIVSKNSKLKGIVSIS